MTTYFLSYARADEHQALRFANDVIAAGVSVWVDQYDIRPSQHWDRAVETAVRGCRGMIVILSPRSTASPNVADEISIAIDDSKDIIPILIEPCTLPLRMTRMQYIDATRDHDGAVRRCLAVIGAHEPTQPHAPAHSGQAPPVLAPEILREAERHLTSFMGPIAPVLVRRAAARATSQPELYQALAASIANPADRKSFLDWLTEPAAPGQVVTPRTAGPSGSIAPEDIKTITAALTRHLGPIAAHLISREMAGAASRRDLCQKLAARLSAEKDRAAFLKETEAL